jgi:hypothetical protein
VTKANESVRGFEGVAAAAAASRLLREKRISLSFFHVFCSFRSPDSKSADSRFPDPRAGNLWL